MAYLESIWQFLGLKIALYADCASPNSKALLTGRTLRPFAMAPIADLIRSLDGLLPTAMLSVQRRSRLMSIFSKAV